MNKRYLLGLLVFFVLANLGYTYWQNYQRPLDGDLVLIILPAPWYAPVLHDPFGWAVLTKNEVYPATNRFFAHATMSLYWKQVPLLLQFITTPISSLYAASALFTTLTQALLVFTLAAYIQLSGARQKSWWTFWLAAALVLPLFQTYGFYEQMGITNWAITYTSFYAFPMALLLLLLWPFYKAAHHRQPLHLHPLRVMLLVLLMVVIAFNGPVTVAVSAVLLLGIGVYWAWKQWQLSPRRLILRPAAGSWLSAQALLLLGTMAALCLYSLYIGRNNSENSHSHTLRELYKLLPQGIDSQLTYDWGLGLLIFGILFNNQLIRWFISHSPERRRILLIMRWVALFAVAYILLLPLGGYRSYRPLLLRNDSILPVLLGFVFAYGLSAYFILFQLRGYLLGAYLTATIVFAGTFVYVDKMTSIPQGNGCEQWALDQIARSTEPVVRISNHCNVLTWEPIADPSQSEFQAMMLQYWNITKHTRRYYQ